MDFTANKPLRARDTGSRQSNRNFSLHAVSPPEYPNAYDSPSLDKPLNYARTSDKQNGTLRLRYEGSLLRSPIDPLVGSRASFAEDGRVEVETLLLQIGRLRGLLLQSSELQAHEVARLKQEYEQTNFLQMSSFRQREHSQGEIYQFQLRKIKEQLAEKAEEQQKLQVRLQREKKCHQQQKGCLREQVRLLISKKNAEICDLQQQLEERVRRVVGEKEQEIGEVKYNYTREVNNINKLLQGRNREVQRLVNVTAEGESERQKLLQKATLQREQIETRYEQRISDQYAKYQNLKQNFNQLIAETTEIQENNWQNLQEMFNAEYDKLFQLLKHKDVEVAELRKQTELELAASKAQRDNAEQETQLVKRKLKEQATTFQQEIQLLKVKIAALHQSDLQSVKALYQLRHQHALQANSRLQGQNSKLRQMLQQSNVQRYEMKQRYDMTVSQLNSKMLKMRMGMHSLQTDFRQKMQNQKSLMLMTSRSFLKEAEVKSHNNKFLQEETRKLRQLIDLMTRQNQNAEKAVEEKILSANNQLERLTSQVVSIAQEKKELEQSLDNLRKEKDREIARLKGLLNDAQKPELSVGQESKLIEELKQERNQKLEEIGKLKDRLASLQSRMKQMKAEVERATMQASINHQQGKRQYHQIAESHLSQFKKFYEQKLRRVQEEKDELKKIINSQYQQITELIKKYRELEAGMKDAVSLMSKRTILEEKVMNLGMDNNLIKNLAQLLPSFQP